jgi:hypothetical protein
LALTSPTSGGRSVGKVRSRSIVLVLNMAGLMRKDVPTTARQLVSQLLYFFAINQMSQVDSTPAFFFFFLRSQVQTLVLRPTILTGMFLFFPQSRYTNARIES